ncbi:MAG: sugar transporter permease [Acidimicrobiaceae bacterium]|nr:sugar transporter permease [Acidimicrobiaceae bacterium]
MIGTSVGVGSLRSAAPATRAATSGPIGRRARRDRRERHGRWFVAPFLVVLTLFMFVPLGYALYTSLFTTKLIGGTSFSGLANYRQVLASSDFWAGVRRVALFAVIQVPVTIGLAAFFAAIFDLGVAKFGRFFRLVFFIPFAVPAVVAALMWSFLLLPQFGPYTRLAGAVGFAGTNYFSSKLILATIILIVVWEWTGYNMTILYTALKAVPREVVEAAVIDGASFSRVILRVKLPMVSPAIVMLLFLNLVGALQLFTEPSILSAFQPQAVSFAFTPTLYVYNTAIGSNEYGLGAAAAVVLGLVIGLISVGSLLWRRRRGELA